MRFWASAERLGGLLLGSWKRGWARWKVGKREPSHQAVLLSAASSPLHSQPTPSSRPCRRRSAVSSPHKVLSLGTCTSTQESWGPPVCVCFGREGVVTSSLLNTKISWAWWRMAIVPATWEAEAGESLKPSGWRLQ